MGKFTASKKTSIVNADFLYRSMDAASVYKDYSLSKTKFASELHCSRTTVHSYCDLLWATVEGFRDDTPQDDVSGEFKTDDPLTPYQMWLVSRVRFLMSWFASSKQAKTYVMENPGYFTKHYFLHNLAQVEEMTTVHVTSAVLELAS